MKTNTLRAPLSLLLLLLVMSLTAQEHFTHDNFEDRFLAYQAVQLTSVTDDDFAFAEMVISETKKAIIGDPDGFNVSDYWNICTAFYTLKEKKAHLEIAFQKMLASEGSCEYITSLQDKTQLDELFPLNYQQALNRCALQDDEKVFDRQAYAKAHQLDDQLLQKIEAIAQRDQQYRGEDYQKHQAAQRQLDQENQRLIEQLYQKYQRYLGKSLVGKHFESVMWFVIQHSNLAMMEKYLPVIQQAVVEGELPLTPLKMLIDRIYVQKFQYQIFGSQIGEKMASKEIIEQVRKKYNIP